MAKLLIAIKSICYRKFYKNDAHILSKGYLLNQGCRGGSCPPCAHGVSNILTMVTILTIAIYIIYILYSNIYIAIAICSYSYHIAYASNSNMYVAIAIYCYSNMHNAIAIYSYCNNVECIGAGSPVNVIAHSSMNNRIIVNLYYSAIAIVNHYNMFRVNDSSPARQPVCRDCLHFVPLFCAFLPFFSPKMNENNRLCFVGKVYNADAICCIMTVKTP